MYVCMYVVCSMYSSTCYVYVLYYCSTTIVLAGSPGKKNIFFFKLIVLLNYILLVFKDAKNVFGGVRCVVPGIRL